MKTEQPIDIAWMDDMDTRPCDIADLSTGRDQAYHDTITRYIRELAADQEIDIMIRINLIGDIESLARELISKIEQREI